MPELEKVYEIPKLERRVRLRPLGTEDTSKLLGVIDKTWQATYVDTGIMSPSVKESWINPAAQEAYNDALASSCPALASSSTKEGYCIGEFFLRTLQKI